MEQPGATMIACGPLPPTPAPVQCGNHFAATCAECPQGNGAAWCNDDCKWSSSTSTCVVPVSCGGNHFAATCAECPIGRIGEVYCNEDCEWFPWGACGNSDY